MTGLFPESVHVVIEIVNEAGTILYTHPMLLPIGAAKEFEEILKVTDFWAVEEKYRYSGTKLVADVEENYPQFFEKLDFDEDDEDCDCDEEEEHDILVYNIIVTR